MSGIESITSKIFIPDASNCSDSGNAKLFPDDIAEYGWKSTAAPDSLKYVIEADDSKNINAFRAHSIQETDPGEMKGLWQFFASAFGRNPGINPNFRPPEDVNRTWIA